MSSQFDKQIPTDKLKIGMYVSALDRPWTDGPFSFVGGVIQSEAEIELLKHHCKNVSVNLKLSQKAEDPATLKLYQKTSAKAPAGGVNRSIARTGKPYQTTLSVEEEVLNIAPVYEQLLELAGDVIDNARKGRSPDLSFIRDFITPLVQSAVRNPDALLWITMSNNNRDYDATHAVNTAVTAVIIGRQLNLLKRDLAELAIGGLLLDVGKAQLPVTLLNKPAPLDKHEFKAAQSHLHLSLKLLAHAKEISLKAQAMALYHHERHDGSGYPAQLKGENIPLFGRIAALADSFSAMTLDRPYSIGMSPYHAVQELYEGRDTLFQDQLIESFMHIVGLYPAGTLVELSNGEICTVIGQHETRRLRPKLVRVLDKFRRPCPELKVIDLCHESHDEEGKPLDILHAVKHGLQGIDNRAICYRFIQQQEHQKLRAHALA